MKQNSQWLSQVRTWSNSALSTSAPSGSPARFSAVERQLEAAAAEVDLHLGLVGQQAPPEDVAGHLAVQPAAPRHQARCRRARPATRARQRRLGAGSWLQATGYRPGPTSVASTAWMSSRVLLGVSPRLLRRRGDGDQGAGLDGPDLRAARLLLPRDRPQQAGGRPVQGPRRHLRRRDRRGARRRADHAVRPRVRPRGRRGGPRQGLVRRRQRVPARDQGPPRGQGARGQGLPHRLRRPRGPRGGGGHDGRRARGDPPGGVGRGGRRAAGARRPGGPARADHALPPRLGRRARRHPGALPRTSGRPDGPTSASPPPTASPR